MREEKRRRMIAKEGVGEGEREKEREGDMLQGLSPPNQKCWLRPCIYQYIIYHITSVGIDVAENDDDNRFQTGSRNNAVSAHVQENVCHKLT